MRYTVTDRDIFEDNPELKAIPEFADKPSRSLKYIFLVFDFDSPYSGIPLEKRKEVVAKDVGYKMEKDKEGNEIRLDKNAREIIAGKNKAMEEVRKKFDLLQNVIEKRLIAGFDAQMEEWIGLMNKTNKSDKEQAYILNVFKELDRFLLKRKRILEILNLSKEEEEKEEKDLSDIDKYNQGIL